MEAGTARLVGTDPHRIVTETARLLDDPHAHAAMAQAHSPFGDGHAAPRIAALVARITRDEPGIPREQVAALAEARSVGPACLG